MDLFSPDLLEKLLEIVSGEMKSVEDLKRVELASQIEAILKSDQFSRIGNSESKLAFQRNGWFGGAVLACES